MGACNSLTCMKTNRSTEDLLAMITKHYKIKLFYFILFERERQHEWRSMSGGEAEGEKEADSPLSREPDVGLDPRTLRS